MQLTLRTPAPVLALFLGAGSCGGDVVEVEPDEQLLGLFSVPAAGEEVEHVMRLEIKTDGTATRTQLSGCVGDGVEEDRVDWDYVWQTDGPEMIVLTDPTGENLSEGSEIRVSPGFSCNQIRVVHIIDGQALSDYQMFRGAACPFPTDCFDCLPCRAFWCDEPPEPCE